MMGFFKSYINNAKKLIIGRKNMLDEERFTKAFQLVDRYEAYRLIRTWGVIISIIGVGRFLTSSIFISLAVEIFGHDSDDIIRIRIFQSIIPMLIILFIAVFVTYAFLSLKKTIIRENEIVSTRFLEMGLALVLLFLLTFMIKIPGSIYFEETVGVFIVYILLKNSILSSDFKEVLYLGFALLIVSILESIWRIIYIFFFLDINIDSPSVTNFQNVPLFILSYISLAFIFMIPYIVSGQYSVKKASKLLESPKI